MAIVSGRERVGETREKREERLLVMPREVIALERARRRERERERERERGRRGVEGERGATSSSSSSSGGGGGFRRGQVTGRESRSLGR